MLTVRLRGRECEPGEVENAAAPPANVFRGEVEKVAVAVGEDGPYDETGTPRVLAGMGMLQVSFMIGRPAWASGRWTGETC